jgi:hypothetical protein
LWYPRRQLPRRAIHLRRTAPEGAGDIPGGVDDIPDRAGNTPDSAGNTPDRAGNIPDRAGDIPDRAGESPEFAGDTPEAGDDIPGRAEDTPEIGGESPEVTVEWAGHAAKPTDGESVANCRGALTGWGGRDSTRKSVAPGVNSSRSDMHGARALRS